MPKEEAGTLRTDEGDINQKTAGPYREEIGQQINAQTMGQDPATGGDAATAPNRDGSLGDKETDAVGTNPKRNNNSRPD